MKKILIIVDHIGSPWAQSYSKKLYQFRKSIKFANLKFFSLRKNINDPPKSKDLFISKTTHKFDLHSIWELKNYIKKEKIKIIQPLLPKSLLYSLFLKIFFFPNLKIISYEHGTIFKNFFLYNKFLSLFQNKINLFLAVSQATKNKLMKNANINSKKIKVIYNFVDLDKFDPQKYDKNKERKKLGLEKRDFVIGYVGRLVPLKNIDKLIKSLTLIKKRIPQVKLLIVGDGPERNKLKKLSKKLKVEKQTLFLGYQENIPQLISVLDIGCLISNYENLSQTLLEFIAMNKPVFVSKVGGNIEVAATKIAEFINPFTVSSEEISKKIIKLSYKKIKPSEYEKIKRSFTFEKYVKILEKIFFYLE